MKRRTRTTWIAMVAVTALLFAGLASGCGGSGSPSTSATPASTSGSGVSGAVLPVDKNPISNNSTAPGLTITKVLVENNVSPDTGKPVDDHLEIGLKNTSSKPLDHFSVYYEFVDNVAGSSEGYFAELGGLVIDPGATEVVNFDNTGAPGHYPENEFSLFHTSKNALDVNVEVSSPGAKPATFTVQKDSASAEAGVE